MDQWPAPMLKTFTGPAPDPAVANTDCVAGRRHRRSQRPRQRQITGARILSAISLGGKADGVQLLQPDTIDLIFEVQSDGPDLVLAITR